jgi:hypothetical protein
MPAATTTHSRKTGRKTSDPLVLRVQVQDGMGNPRWVTADLIDSTPSGIGISLMTVLQPASTVVVRGRFGKDKAEVHHKAGVKWCAEAPNGSFRAGLEFLDLYEEAPSAKQDGDASASSQDSAEADHYEVMQLSPNADSETIDRVYRLLAQRYHPDNTQTGNSDVFIRLTEAYRTLSVPEQRAKYDAHYHQNKQVRWKIFDQARAAAGLEGEQRKRQGILGLLYAKTLHDPERGSMTIFEMEDLLGCPREHLQAALWFLRGKEYIQRADNGRHTITVLGFEEAERNPSSVQLPDIRLLRPGSRN